MIASWDNHVLISLRVLSQDKPRFLRNRSNNVGKANVFRGFPWATNVGSRSANVTNRSHMYGMARRPKWVPRKLLRVTQAMAESIGQSRSKKGQTTENRGPFWTPRRTAATAEPTFDMNGNSWFRPFLSISGFAHARRDRFFRKKFF